MVSFQDDTNYSLLSNSNLLNQTLQAISKSGEDENRDGNDGRCDKHDEYSEVMVLDADDMADDA